MRLKAQKTKPLVPVMVPATKKFPHFTVVSGLDSIPCSGREAGAFLKGKKGIADMPTAEAGWFIETVGARAGEPSPQNCFQISLMSW